jgi:uncharacterized membrane protein
VPNLGYGRSLAEPVRALGRDAGVRAMLAVAAIYALSSQFDKIVVQQSNPIFGSAIVTLLLGGFFLLHTVASSAGRSSRPAPRNAVGAMAALGGLLAVEVVAINAAFLFMTVPYAVALKRTSSVFSVAYGCALGGESDLRHRAAGALVMGIGATVVLVSSSQ